MKYDAIVVASGKGSRASLGYNKVFFKMANGKSVLENACSLFLEDDDCAKVVVVCEENPGFEHAKLSFTRGGKERKDSVYNGLLLCNSPYVMIHDGARPFLLKEDLNKLKEDLEEYGAAILALKAVDTIKRVKDGMIAETINREEIYMAQTPQAAKRELLTNAYHRLIEEEVMVTDDASVLEYIGEKVKIIEGHKSNRKLTNPEDFEGIGWKE